jgi:hypothetical protein
MDGRFGRIAGAYDSGTVTTNFPGHKRAGVRALMIQPDGKIVAAGSTSDSYDPDSPSTQFAVARYHANGQLDRSFGNAGRVETGFGGVDAAHDIVPTVNGGFILGGSVTDN